MRRQSFNADHPQRLGPERDQPKSSIELGPGPRTMEERARCSVATVGLTALPLTSRCSRRHLPGGVPDHLWNVRMKGVTLA
jgi:hypothetical protein